MLLCRIGSPFLLLGPFGTGKTHLLAAAVIKLITSGPSRILICTHQNKGANHLCDMLLARDRGFFQDIVRLYPNLADAEKSSRSLSGVAASVKDIPLHVLRRKNVVITTCMTAMKMREMKGEGMHFTHIIIDEGAQSREPEALAGLLMADRDTHIIIAGDNQQVGPKVAVLNDLARENGLGDSLLERLLNIYRKKFDHQMLNYHRYSLLTNYRCHPSILLLASSLFYECTLLGRSESKPHPMAPFPLVFECSSLDQHINKVSSPVNEREAEIIVRKAIQFARTWPTDESQVKIAILAGSARQVDCLRSHYKAECKAKGSPPSRIKVEITYTYTIQGEEFDAVFLSTHEVTDNHGKPCNKVRSICDRYVFNTVITRSRSLLFAVGNPFLLVKMGAHFEINCWAEYVQRCLVCQTLHLLEVPNIDMLPQRTSCLTEMVLPKQLLTEVEGNKDTDKLDEVLEGYMRLLQCRSERFRGMKLVQDPKKGEKYWHSDLDADQLAGKTVLAELTLSSYRSGLVVPQQHNTAAIKVHSKDGRRCAFSGDKVLVDTETKQIVLNRDTEQRFAETHFGHSILCRVNEKNMISFMPLDIRYPVIVNLPSLTKNDKHGVTCFEPSSINDRLKVNHFIPKECAVNMVFVVKVLKWKMDCPNPLGIVIGALPCGTSAHSGDLLLRVANGISLAESPSPVDLTARKVKVSQTKPQFSDVLTIDPPGSADHDDALSCVHKHSKEPEHVYEVGVHITDVQKFIAKGSKVDTIARNKSCSVYSSSDTCVSHMLPNTLVKQASIIPNVTRDAFSVVGLVSVVNRRVCGCPYSVKIFQSQIKSTQELTYESAQGHLTAKKGRRRIKTLWLIARYLRDARLGEAASHLSVKEADEVLHAEAHILVEELMIWANQQVAQKLLNVFPSTVILRCQPKPDEEKLQQMVESHGNLMAVSPALKHHVPSCQTSYGSVHVLHETIASILEELDKSSVEKALRYIQFEHLHPQIAAAHSLFKTICQTSSYCVTKSLKGDDDVAHASLRCEHYTHFTSPIRRYCDVVVQRMLFAALQEQENPYEDDPQELEDICKEMMDRVKKANRYEKEHKRLLLALRLRECSYECLAFVKGIEEAMFSLLFSDLALSVINDSCSIQLKHLNAAVIHQQRESSPEAAQSATDDTSCSWQVKVASASGCPGHFLHHPHLLQGMSDSHRTSTRQAEICFFVPDDLDKKVADSNLRQLKISAAIKPYSHSIPEANWRALQNSLKADSSAMSCESVKELLSLPCHQIPRRPFPSIPVAPLWIYKLTRPLDTCEILKVQMSASFTSRSQSVCPVVQLVEVGPNLRVCIQHNRDPIACFTNTSFDKPPPEGFSRLDDYFNYWERLVLVEAAASSLTDTELFLITDVNLKWPSLTKVIDSQGQAYHRLPNTVNVKNSDCACLKLSATFVESSYDFFSFNDGDFVCVRCCEDGDGSVKSVLHMVVHSVVRELDGDDVDNECQIFLKFVSENSNYISQEMENAMHNGHLSYEVQLIPLTLPYRRIYRNLSKLKSHHKRSLVGVICLGKATCQHLGSLPEISKQLSSEEAKEATCLWTKENSDKSKGQLNEFQIDAIRLALSNDFVMIQGPPGTGKSITGAHLAYVLAMKLRKEVGSKRRNKKADLNPCVMYCGPSQQSVNVVLDILVSSVEVKNSNLNIVRVFSKSIAQKDFPGPKSNKEVFPGFKTDGQCEPKFTGYSLHHLIRKANPKICLFDEEFAKLSEKNKIPSHKSRCNYNATLDNTSIDVLKDDVDIVLCTCNEAASYRIQSSVRPVYCIVDECGMATEPECLVPIRRAEHVVLIGDHKQLQPVLSSKLETNMGVSLFERYVKSKTSVHMLEIQHRMHEALCSFPSREFYADKLKTDESVAVKYSRLLDRLDNFWPKGRDMPLLFCNVVGEEEENHTGRRGTARVGLESKRNYQEAKKVIEVAQHLITNYEVTSEEIVIITPYSAQKEEIKSRLARGGIDRVLVKTITESQGSEFGIVLLSMVRSQDLTDMFTADRKRIETDFSWKGKNLGFIRNRHQICVGITRCQYGLLIVGNEQLLRFDTTWETLIKHYHEQGCVVDGDTFPVTTPTHTSVAITPHDQ